MFYVESRSSGAIHCHCVKHEISSAEANANRDKKQSNFFLKTNQAKISVSLSIKNMRTACMGKQWRCINGSSRSYYNSIPEPNLIAYP
jgi:hypothetical protein